MEGIRELRPDVITLQKTIVSGNRDGAADLLGEDFYIVHSEQREPDGQGISIASRWPITKAHELDLNVTPRTGDFACTTLIAKVDAPPPFGPILLVNHFPDYQVVQEHERELETVLAARHIEETIAAKPMHVLLAGDLDAEQDASSLRFLAGKQSLEGLSVCYRSAWESAHPGGNGGTFAASNPLAPNDWPYERIDHIFVRCGQHGGPTLGIAACELAFNEPINGVWASNHFGLVADLTHEEDGGAQCSFT
jgi:endonuclease/exonuclease/phosphatase family metal-dependent hydrolase